MIITKPELYHYGFHGKQVFKFSEEFTKKTKQKLEAVQEATMAKVLEELIFFTKKYVYSKPESSNAFYERTELLLKLFEVSDVYSHGGTYGGVYGGIEPNRNIFEENQNADEWQNDSNLDEWRGEISATDFVNIINNGVTMTGEGKKHSMFGERPATRFWDEFIDYMLNQSEYRRLFVQTAQELGYDMIDGGFDNYVTTRSNIKGKNKSINLSSYRNLR